MRASVPCFFPRSLSPSWATRALALPSRPARLLERYSREPVWMGTIAAYGDFWVRRASVGLTVARDAGKLTVRLDRPGAALGPDLALVVAGAEPPEAIQVLDRNGILVPHRVLTCDGRRIVALGPKSR
jgi:hypothetical protein